MESEQPQYDDSVDPSPADNYPDLNEVLADMLEHEDFPTGDLERVELTMLASGEATWRVWASRAEEPIGGYYVST